MKFQDIEPLTPWGNYKVDVPWNYLEDTLKKYQTDYNLDLDPDFQRGHVWTPDKQIAYVEYILRGGQFSRHIIFNCPGWMNDFEGQMVLVDGKQRIQAVRKFLSNELPVFNGYRLKDFEGNERIPYYYDFTFHINNLRTRAEVLKFYLDLNSGGVIHTEEELNRVRDLLAQEMGNCL